MAINNCDNNGWDNSLANNKEEFGSLHNINYVYEKILSD